MDPTNEISYIRVKNGKLETLIAPGRQIDRQ